MEANGGGDVTTRTKQKRKKGSTTPGCTDKKERLRFLKFK